MEPNTPITGNFTPKPKGFGWLTRLLHHKHRFWMAVAACAVVVALLGLGFAMPWRSGRVKEVSSTSPLLTGLVPGLKSDAQKEADKESEDDDQQPGEAQDGTDTESNTEGGGSGGSGGGGSGGGGSGGGGSGGSVGAMPTMATVGPRYASTRTISAAQALTELRSTGYLSRATVTGTFTLSGTDGIGWVIEDVRFESGSLYGLRAYAGGGAAFAGTQAQRAVFRYVRMVGRGALGTGSCSAVVYGRDVIIENADIYGCVDGIKASDRMVVRRSWVHDLDHPSGAHSDTVQIVSGTDIVFEGNRFDAYVGYSSDGSGGIGNTGSGMLQTGSVTGDISATWTGNWFAGGHYTVRGSTDPRVHYVFRNNRWLRYGTSVALGLSNLQPNRYGPIYGGVQNEDFDNSNVWDDTGLPVAD